VGVGVDSGVGVVVGSGVGVRVRFGIGVGVCFGVGVGDCSGVESGVRVVDARGIFGLGVGVVTTAVAGADFIGCASKTAFSRPYKETKISMMEAPLISFRISLQFAKTPPSRHR
jgi:hypothetical protein